MRSGFHFLGLADWLSSRPTAGHPVRNVWCLMWWCLICFMCSDFLF